MLPAFSVDIKRPRNIKPKVDVAICPISNRLCDISFLDHRSTVGKMQLEDMAARLNIKTQTEGIPVLRCELIGKNINVFGIE